MFKVRLEEKDPSKEAEKGSPVRKEPNMRM